MITEAIGVIVTGIINLMIFYYPNFTGLTTEQNSSIDSWFNVLRQANSIFPVDTLLTVVLLAVGIELVVVIWRIAEWALAKILPTGQGQLF